MEIWHSVLAGIGLRHALTTAAGRHVGVVTHRTGRRDLVIHARSGRDSTVTVVLTPAEASWLAGLLCKARIVDRRLAPRSQTGGMCSEQAVLMAGPAPRQTQPDRRVSAL